MFARVIQRIPNPVNQNSMGLREEPDNTVAPAYPWASNGQGSSARANAPAFPGAQPTQDGVLLPKAPAFPPGVIREEPVAPQVARVPQSVAEQQNMRTKILAALGKRTKKMRTIHISWKYSKNYK